MLLVGSGVLWKSDKVESYYLLVWYSLIWPHCSSGVLEEEEYSLGSWYGGQLVGSLIIGKEKLKKNIERKSFS